MKDIPHFEGFGWHSTITSKDLSNLRNSYGIPDLILLELPRKGAIDEEGFAEKVALLVCALTHSLRLPFCCPIRDFLDLLELDLVQLRSHAWIVLLCSCRTWSPLRKNTQT